MAVRGFPQFSDGDVEILLGGDQKLLLHSKMLSVHSEWFKSSFSDRWATSGSDASSMLGGNLANGEKRWIYELRFGKDDSEGILMRQGQENAEPSKPGEVKKPTEMISADHAADELADARLECVKAHRNLLNTLYHCVPSLSHQSFQKAKASIEMFVDVAELYRCEHVVRASVENHLGHFRADVLDACAKEPVNMLGFSLRLKCDWIFMEAATNLLASPKPHWDVSQAKLAELGISELLNAKRAVFTQTLKDAEHAIYSLRPVLSTANGAWSRTAFHFLTDELQSALESSRGSALGLGYASIYHSIFDNSLTGRAARQDRAAAYYQSIFSDAARFIQGIMREVNCAYSIAQRILQPLLLDVTRRQPKNHGDMSRPLTFMVIEDDELPWAKT